jgi:hypothetical protein
MKKILLIVMAAVFVATAASAANVTLAELMDQYWHATDVQKRELERKFIGQRMSARGVIENAGEYNFFDINTDTGEQYYRVITRQQETAARTPYQVVFMYKNKNSVVNLSKGETMDKEGVIINIVDERLQVSVWVYEDELTPRDRELFQLQYRPNL